MIEDLKTEISELSVRDKIELLNCLYHDLSGHGTDGDTELAHINAQEAAILKALGGSGTVNEITGLRQYGKGGGSPAPAPSSTSTTQEIPEELKPYITDILGKSQAIQEKRTAEGYRPYQGQSLADFTPEQQRAMQGISGLVGTSQQYLDPAARLTAASAMTPTGEEVSQYMSPYMQQVVDIQQREARRAADVSGQQLAAQAVGAGGFGGSRQAILEAEAGRNLQTQLGDIQARGLAGAYEDAQRRLTEQRQRQLAGGAQFAQMAPTAISTGLQELGALQQAGGMRQAQSQAALDIARQQFEAEKAFPEQTLQQYSSIIRGYAMDPNRTTTTYTPAPSTLQQIAGLGTTALAGGKAFGLFKEGGKVGDGKGLASIIVKRQAGGRVIKKQAGGPLFDTSIDTPYLDSVEGSAPPYYDPNDVASRVPLGIDPLLRFAIPKNFGEDSAALARAQRERAAARDPLIFRQVESLGKLAEESPEEKSYLETLKKRDFGQERQSVEKEYQQGIEGATQNKWLALLGAGLNIMGQEGGQSTLQAIGKGFSQSGFVKNVSDAAREERDLAKQKRKELASISDQELANQANIAGITKQQQRDKINAEIKGLDIQIAESERGYQDAKDILGAKTGERREALAAAKLLSDLNEAQARLAKAAQEKGLKPADLTSMRKNLAQQYGYVYDEKTGSIMIGNTPLKADDPVKLNFEQNLTRVMQTLASTGSIVEAQKMIELIAQERANSPPAGNPPPANKGPLTTGEVMSR
jgi:hypothetical protein